MNCVFKIRTGAYDTYSWFVVCTLCRGRQGQPNRPEEASTVYTVNVRCVRALTLSRQSKKHLDCNCNTDRVKTEYSVCLCVCNNGCFVQNIKYQPTPFHTFNFYCKRTIGLQKDARHRGEGTSRFKLRNTPLPRFSFPALANAKHKNGSPGRLCHKHKRNETLKLFNYPTQTVCFPMPTALLLSVLLSALTLSLYSWRT